MKAIFFLSILCSAQLVFAYGNSETESDEATDNSQEEASLIMEATPSLSINDMDNLTPDQLSEQHERILKNGDFSNGEGAKVAGPGGNGKIVSVAKCDPSDGLYYLNIHLDGKLVKKCLTSPGLPGSPSNWESRYGNRVRGTKRMHRASKNTTYAGAPMPWTVWIGRKLYTYRNKHGQIVYKYSGYATHATGAIGKLGRPASHGCMRLHPKCAKYHYDLVNRHGANNAEVRFEGYSSKCGGSGKKKSTKKATRKSVKKRRGNAKKKTRKKANRRRRRRRRNTKKKTLFQIIRDRAKEGKGGFY